MRILIIEDDEETARFLTDGLRARRHHPEVAKNGRDGVEMAIRGRFDVIILDRMLPHLDGLGVVALTRGWRATLAPPPRARAARAPAGAN